MRALVIHWNIDPVMFTLGEHVFRWYSVLFLAIPLIAWFGTRWIARREGVRADVYMPLLFWTFIGFYLGGKLGFRFFYATGSFHGFSSFGAAAGMFLVMWLFSITKGRQYDISFLWLTDRDMLMGVWGCVPVRIGNFFNSELFGTPSDLPWAVVFERVDFVPRHPVQLYEAAAFLALGVVLLWLYLRRMDRLPRGFMAGLSLVCVSVIRFLFEFVKVSTKNIDFGIFSLHTAQVLCIPLFLLGLGILLYVRRHPVPSRLRK